jgi:hypothetical protein
MAQDALNIADEIGVDITQMIEQSEYITDKTFQHALVQLKAKNNRLLNVLRQEDGKRANHSCRNRQI